jgi:hypothetical protein
MGIIKLRLLIFTLPLILSAAVLCGLGGQEKSETPQTIRATAQATGRVRLVGSGPGMELVITGTNREWHMDKKDQDKLLNLQQQTVTVEGEESSQEMTFANGRSAGTRYVLRNIKIIEPSEH